LAQFINRAQNSVEYSECDVVGETLERDWIYKAKWVTFGFYFKI
jgi:hypothetical protein